MEDILVLENNSIKETVIDETEFKDNQFSDSDIGSYKSLDEDSLKEEESIDEFKQINKSDDIIFGSDGSNNNISYKSINVNTDLLGFDKTLIWSNPNPYSNLNTGYITLNESYKKFDYILINYIDNTTSKHESSVLVSSDDFEFKGTVSPVVYVGIRSNTPSYYSRCVFGYNDQMYTYTNSANVGVIQSVYGLTEKTVVEPTPTPNPDLPSVSGNIVNNYYNIYCDGVSENAVSWNLINKPINEYSVSESLLGMSVLFMLAFGFVLLMRKAVFRWR